MASRDVGSSLLDDRFRDGPKQPKPIRCSYCGGAGCSACHFTRLKR